MKKKIVAAALALGLTCSSCLGPDHLYNSVKNWNAGISEKDWITETVFVGMMIIPVYPIALFVDVVVLNTVDYWGGKDTQNDPFPGFSRND